MNIMKNIFIKIAKLFIALLSIVYFIFILYDSTLKLATFPTEHLRGPEANAEVLVIIICYALTRSLNMKKLSRLTLLGILLAVFNRLGFMILYKLF